MKGITTLFLMLFAAGANAQLIEVTDFQVRDRSIQKSPLTAPAVEFLVLVHSDCYEFTAKDLVVAVQASKKEATQLVEVQIANRPRPAFCDKKTRGAQALSISSAKIDIKRPMKLLNSIRLGQ